MKKAICFIIVILLAIPYSCALADGFSLRNDITFGDSMDDVLRKETLTIGKGEHIRRMENQHLDQINFRLRLQDIEEIYQGANQTDQCDVDKAAEQRDAPELLSIFLRFVQQVLSQKLADHDAAARCQSVCEALDHLLRYPCDRVGGGGVRSQMAEDKGMHRHAQTPGQRACQHAGNDLPDVFFVIL